MSLKLTFSATIGQFDEAFKAMVQPVANAAQGAIRDVANMVKAEGRANIAAAGFSKRWQNAYRQDVFPRRGASINAAVWIYHKIPYAIAFEQGATIRGRPKLWVPLTGTPKKIGRNRMTPQRLASTAGNILFPIQRGRRTFLAARVRVPKAQADADRINVTLPMLKRAERVGVSSGRKKGAGVLKSVPLFVGVDSVTLRKRFALNDVAKRAADRLPQFYLKNFEGN